MVHQVGLLSVFKKTYSWKNGRTYKEKKKCNENTLAKTFIPRIENVLAEEDSNSEEYKLELAVSQTTVTVILEEIKRFDRDIFDAIEDNKI